MARGTVWGLYVRISVLRAFFRYEKEKKIRENWLIGWVRYKKDFSSRFGIGYVAGYGCLRQRK